MANRLTTEQFIEKATKVHGNKYGYGFVEYTNSYTKVIITCGVHGNFKQTPESHLKGSGCSVCGGSNRLTTEQFIEKATKIHGNTYEYINTEYYNSRTKITITCDIHGDFKQTPESHLKGSGCQKCYIENHGKENILTPEQIKSKSKSVHGNTYEYIIEKKTKTREHITIVCKIHGEFRQTVANHIHQKAGCSVCASELTISKSEQELSSFVSTLSENVTTSDRNLISPLELDIVVPDHNLAIEFNGSFYHNFDHKNKNYHKMKSNLCEEKGYRLIHVYEYDWIFPNKQKIIKSIIESSLGLNKRIFARKCKIKQFSVDLERKFVDGNHLQGYSPSTVAFGLFYDDELVQMISLKVTNKDMGSWEIQRMCNKLNYSIIGGGSKLFKQCLIYLK